MERKIHVWHDQAGQIMAWGYVPDGAPEWLGAIPLPHPDHKIITVQVPVANLPRLHETHYVEPSSKKLVPRNSH